MCLLPNEKSEKEIYTLSLETRLNPKDKKTRKILRNVVYFFLVKIDEFFNYVSDGTTAGASLAIEVATSTLEIPPVMNKNNSLCCTTSCPFLSSEATHSAEDDFYNMHIFCLSQILFFFSHRRRKTRKVFTFNYSIFQIRRKTGMHACIPSSRKAQ